jgi:hypothetical protein
VARSGWPPRLHEASSFDSFRVPLELPEVPATSGADRSACHLGRSPPASSARLQGARKTGHPEAATASLRLSRALTTRNRLLCGNHCRRGHEQTCSAAGRGLKPRTQDHQPAKHAVERASTAFSAGQTRCRESFHWVASTPNMLSKGLLLDHSPTKHAVARASTAPRAGQMLCRESFHCVSRRPNTLCSCSRPSIAPIMGLSRLGCEPPLNRELCD